MEQLVNLKSKILKADDNFLSLCSFKQEQMSQVLDAMFEKLVEGGEHVIDQGDDGDNFYVIDR